jgi:hypothetical protein
VLDIGAATAGLDIGHPVVGGIEQPVHVAAMASARPAAARLPRVRGFGGQGRIGLIVLPGAQQQAVLHDPRLDAAFDRGLGDAVQRVGIGRRRLGPEEPVFGGEVRKYSAMAFIAEKGSSNPSNVHENVP